MIEKKKVKKLGDVKVFFTLFKSFCVTGILFLPKTYYNGGWLFCTIFLILAMGLNLICANFLLDTRAKHQTSLSGLGFKAGGKWGKIIIDIFIGLSQFLFVCAYIGFISTSLHSIIYSLWGIQVNHWWFGLVCFGIYAPISMV
jgi:proton-coupled amino acid transporter